jgi:hypothetical protein
LSTWVAAGVPGWPGKYLDDLVEDDRVGAAGGEVLDAAEGRDDDRNEGSDRVAQALVLDVEDIHEEVEALALRDAEDVAADELLDQALAQLGGDLKGVDAEREEDFDDALDVAVGEVLLELGLVVLDD